MMSTLHLLWIVPVAVTFGVFIMVLMTAAGDKEE